MNSMDKNGLAIEWAPFTLVEGVEETQLLAASDLLQQEFLGQQPGFIRRELLRGPGRQWFDLVYWETLAAAEQAGQQAMNSPVCFRYFSLMEGADHADLSAGVFHAQQVKSYGN
jgi:hypothetical protein